MTVLRPDFTKRISKRLPIFFEKDIENAVRTIISTLSQALVDGERIEVRGFGSFEMRTYKQRHGVNPRDGTPVELKPRRLPYFRPSKTMLKVINETNNATGKVGDR